MITLYNNQKISLDTKIALAVQNALAVAGSDFEDTKDTKWVGDNLTIESLFQEWILKEYENNSTNVTIVPIIKNYLRWLFSLEYGYGAQLDWEKIRVPYYINSLFLESLADFYFPNADFSQSPLKEKLPNIRKFATKADANYFNIKGTPDAIKYVICSLLGFSFNDVYIVPTTYSNFEVRVSSSKLTSLKTFDSFLSSYVFPAGIIVNYKSF